MSQQNILIIGTVWPEPASTAAGSRMLQIVSLFLSQGWDVNFASAATKGPYSYEFEDTPVSCFPIELNNSSFDSFIKELQPSIVMFDRFMVEEQFGWRVAKNCPDALRILDTEDLHCLRDGRIKAYKEKREFRNADLLSDMAKREIASIMRCDLSLIISTFEMSLLKDFFKVEANLLFYLPFLFEKSEIPTIEQLPDFNDRKDFVSIGNFLHEPNRNSVLFLKEEIWPLIRKALPEAQLNIYGAYPTQQILNLNNPKEGFNVWGRAEKAREVIKNARVFLAPLRFGAGLKGKLAEAMICGTPSLTTAIGAEAMHAGLEWSGIIADQTNDFAQGAVALYTNLPKWELAQKNGLKILNQLFLMETFESSLIKQIFFVQENLKKHREDNFFGSMLMHHTLQSTKYMSRWIEAKNNSKTSNH